MKVFVENPGASVDRIAIRLKSADTNLVRICKPLGFPYDPDPHKGNELFIVLDDSYEINMLIDALEEFKKVNYAHFGEWRLKP